MADLLCGATSLRYRQTGTGAPAVLLIHGTAAALWGDLPERLGACHRVVDHDRRGYDGSTGPAPATLGEHTDDAAQLIDRLDLAPAVVVGWSVGGILALDLAVRYPALVAGLVLLEPPLHAKRHPTPRLLRGVVGGVLAGRRDPAAGADRFLRWALLNTAHRRPEDAVPAGWWDRMLANGPAIVQEIGLGTGEHLTPAALGGIRCPVVVLHGDRSAVDFRRAARRLAARVPTARLEAVTGSGHPIQADRPDAVVAAVEGLLSRGRPEPAPPR
jgi:pimeloyl-ACP methyl ester carboxylesterase